MSNGAELFGVGFAGLVVLLWVLIIAYTILAPFLAVSAVRNIKRSRLALERIADALESPTRTSGAGLLKL